MSVGLTIRTMFEITAGINPANLAMLNSINYFLGKIGRIETVLSSNIYRFRITVLKKHFDTYPLFTYKLFYY